LDPGGEYFEERGRVVDAGEWKLTDECGRNASASGQTQQIARIKDPPRGRKTGKESTKKRWETRR